MTVKIFLFVLSILIIAVGVPRCDASAAVPVKLWPGQTKGPANPEPGFVRWLNGPWSGDDSPYALLRAQVEQSEKDGDLETLVQSSEAAYRANPTSFTKQYEYFYALNLNLWENDVGFTWPETQDVDNFTTASMRFRYPRTYNYARLMSLCLNCWSTDPNLYPFLERLVSADPNDVVARYLVPVMLSSTDKPALQVEAIRLAEALAAEYPNIAPIRAAVGYAYYRRWTETKDPVQAQKAIIAYQSYLNVDPPNGDFRPIAEQIIKLIQEGGS